MPLAHLSQHVQRFSHSNPRSQRQPASEAMQPLPPGWEAHYDAHSRLYYVHRPSGTTQWQPPAPAPGYHHAYAPPPPPPTAPQYAPTGYPAGPSGAPGRSSAPGKPSAPGAQRHAMNSAAARHVHSTPREYKLKEKLMSLSGDSFTVTELGSGKTTFKMKGRVAAIISEKKVLSDAHGNGLYTLTEAMISLRDRMTISDAATKQPVLTTRKKGVIPHLGTGTILCWSGASENGNPYLVVKGNFLKKSFSVTEADTGKVVATVSRKSNVRSVLAEKDTYVLRVEPGVDTALMVSLAVMIDEHYRDDGTRKGLSSFL